MLKKRLVTKVTTQETVADEEEESIREGTLQIREQSARGDMFEKQVGPLLSKDAANQAMRVAFAAKLKRTDAPDEPDEPSPNLDPEALAEAMDDLQDQQTERQVKRRKPNEVPSASVTPRHQHQQLESRLKGIRGGHSAQFSVAQAEFTPQSGAGSKSEIRHKHPERLSEEAWHVKTPSKASVTSKANRTQFNFDLHVVGREVEGLKAEVAKLCDTWFPSIYDLKNQDKYAEMHKYEKERTRRCVVIYKDIIKLISTQAFQKNAGAELMEKAKEAATTCNAVANLGKYAVQTTISEVGKFESAFDEVGMHCVNALPAHMTYHLMKSKAMELAKFGKFEEVARTIEVSGRFASMLGAAGMEQSEIENRMADFVSTLGMKMLRNLKEKDVLLTEPLDKRSRENGVVMLNTMYRELHHESNGREIWYVCNAMVCITNPAEVPINNLRRTMSAYTAPDDTCPPCITLLFKTLFSASIGSRKMLEIAIDKFEGRESELQAVDKFDAIKDALEDMATAPTGSVLFAQVYAKYIHNVEECKQYILKDQQHGTASEEDIQDMLKELKFCIDRMKEVLTKVPSTRGNPYLGGKFGPDPSGINKLIIIL